MSVIEGFQHNSCPCSWGFERSGFICGEMWKDGEKERESEHVS
jgi:hypothetical protein